MAKPTQSVKPKSTFNLETLHTLEPCEDDPSLVELVVRVPIDQLRLATDEHGNYLPYFNLPFVVRGDFGGIKDAAVIRGGRLTLHASSDKSAAPKSKTGPDPMLKVNR